MEPRRSRRRDRSRLAGIAVATSAVLLVGAACSGSEPTLSEQGARGRQVSLDNGCAGCHGQNGEGGVGPGWIGLPGSDVVLLDGSVIVADDAYLVRAIAEPEADLLADYAIQMPRNDLTGAEIADVIAYIKELDAQSG